MVLLDLAPRAGNGVEAQALARRLGGLPLALHLAGSHLSSGLTRWRSFASYQQALDEELAGARLLRPQPGTAMSNEPRGTVMGTWELSLDHLAAHGLPHARAMLRLLSCYAPTVPIALDLLDPAHLSGLLAAAPADSGPWPGQTDLRVEQALRGLERMGLVATDAGGPAVIVHPVIADANHAHLLTQSSSDPVPALVRQSAVVLVAAAVARLDVTRPASWPLVRALTSHLLALFEATAPYLDGAHLARLGEAASRLTDVYPWIGGGQAIEDLTQVALARTRSLTSSHPVVLALRHRVAYQAAHRGGWRDAEVSFRTLHDEMRIVLGRDHPDTLHAWHELAWSMANQGRWAEAEAVYRRVLAARRRVLGEEHRSTLTTRHELAWSVGSQGRWAEAETAFRQLLPIQRRLMGDAHPFTMHTRHELASLIANQGRYGEAEAAFRELLEAERHVLGEEHPDTLATLFNIACTIADQGRDAEAEAVFRDLLRVEERVLGAHHPDTLATGRELERTMAGRPPTGRRPLRPHK
jgi:tetratricopeptide (TPR) repeat protein